MTPETDQLCKVMARLNKGVCVLGFSGGKDALAAWLYLRNYFHTIIPFHATLIPGIKYIERSLAYYEEVMQTKIERVMCGYFFKSQMFGVFQPYEALEVVDDCDLFHWEGSTYKSPLGHLVAEKYGLPDTHWPAFGFSMYDSLDRIKWVRNTKGKHDKYRCWYPCWNWKPTQVKDYLKQHDISLSEDYLLCNRSLDHIPHFYHLEKIRELYPEDYETIKFWYPFVEAREARQLFREQHFKNSQSVSGQ